MSPRKKIHNYDDFHATHIDIVNGWLNEVGAPHNIGADCTIALVHEGDHIVAWCYLRDDMGVMVDESGEPIVFDVPIGQPPSWWPEEVTG